MEVKDLLPAIDGIKTAAEARFNDIGVQLTESKSRLDAIEQRLVASKGAGDPEGHKSGVDFSRLLRHPSREALVRKSIEKTERIAMPIGIKALVNSGVDADSNHLAFPTMQQRIGIVGTILRPLRLLDAMRSLPTDSNIVEYVRMKWTGGADVQASEGDTKASMELDAELIEARIATIAVLTTVSLQVIADNDALQAEIERIMRHSVLAKLEEQLITGSGTMGRIEGLYTQVAELNSNRDPFPERLGDALQQMETAGFTPNVILLNPSDWFDISMLKDADGNYIYGNPATPARPTMFNRPVITSPSIPLHRALIGDTDQAPLLDRQDVNVAISFENRDNFERNLATIRCELRAGLALYNQGAFRKVSLDPRS